MRDEEAISDAIRDFRDNAIDHEELFDQLIRVGCQPEEAAEIVDVECDASDD